MNVCVALSKLGRKTEWISVLPVGPLGDVIYQCGKDANIGMKHVMLKENEEVGVFYVIPDEKRVFYQRKHSAWARQDQNIFDWKQIFAEQARPWYHVTGISPLTAPGPAHNWARSVETAIELGIPITMDLNHRKLLGTLESLWNMTTPFLKHFKLFVVSLDQLRGLGPAVGYDLPPENASEEDPAWINILKKLYEKFSGPRIACCFKSRDANGVQKRWSVVCDAQGVHSTFNTPVYHKPKDECGGGSSWFAGYLDAFFEKGLDVPSLFAQRRADLMAALSQEVIGDHSTATRKELLEAEKSFENRAAYIGETNAENAEHQIEKAVEWIKKAKIVSILRAKNASLTVKRALELVDLGCKMLEVTLDSTDVHNILKELVAKVPAEKCMIGVGTVTDVGQLDELAKIGIKFAISPISPKGFVQECHRRGILAIPAAFSPNELWKLYRQGARVVKLFPAQLYTPAAMKDVMAVGDFGKLHIMPSGGITPEKANEWLSNGAIAVGIGKNISGGDIKMSETDEGFAAAQKEWLEVGVKTARDLFAKYR
eukprot:TRINITY_DN1464_c1_g1_i4.p1 TRINITY_DN1464_c1_g1~~TRINITY_DN1464_c1_g1_i4.p1  ORF type:complete len:542 (+),score=130.41 TRINITY_DN1464_c1_g1_i4:279-1904(+)